MPNIWMTREELEMGYLPHMCIRCGGAAEQMVRMSFGARKPEERLKMVGPYCARHARVWRIYRILRWVGIIGCFAVIPTGLAGAVLSGRKEVGIVCAGVLVGILVLIGLAILVLEFLTVRPRAFKPGWVELARVADGFAVAVQAQRGKPGAAPAATAGGAGPKSLATGGKQPLADLRDGVRLTQAEMAGQLPPVCMRCGAPAEFWGEQIFQDELVGRPPRGIIGMTLLTIATIRNRMQEGRKVRVPFCKRHRHHWAWRRLFFWAGGVWLVLVVVLAIASILTKFLPVLIAGAVIGIGAAFFIANLILDQFTIVRVQMDEKSIFLSPVAPAFIEALEKQRQAGQR